MANTAHLHLNSVPCPLNVN